MEHPVGLCLVGCGRISAAHLAAVAALPGAVRLVATVDRDIAAAARAAEPFGAQPYASLEAALANPEVEAVLVASPNALHVPQAGAVVASGRHVLVEKPLAGNGADARELARMARERGVVLAVGHTFRHGPAVRYLQDHFSQFGTLRAVQVSACVHWDGPQAPWWAERQPDEGLILSLFAPHSLDFVQLCMGGDDPLRVHAEATRWQAGWQGEDEAMITLAYPGRRLAQVYISYNQPCVIDRKVLHFSGGVVDIEDTERLLFNGEVLVEPAPGVLRNPRAMGGRDLAHFFRTQLAEFALAVRGQPHRCVTGDDAARGIDLLDRVLASARANSRDAIDPPPVVTG